MHAAFAYTLPGPFVTGYACCRLTTMYLLASEPRCLFISNPESLLLSCQLTLLVFLLFPYLLRDATSLAYEVFPRFVEYSIRDWSYANQLETNLHGSYPSRSLCHPTHSIFLFFFFSSSITHEFSRIRWNAMRGKVDGHALTCLAICKTITADVGNANWIFPAIGCRAAATNSLKIEYLSQSTTRLSRRWWSFDQWSASVSAPAPKRVNDGNECKVAVGSKNHRVRVFSPFRILNESLSSDTITMHRIYLQINDAFTIMFRNVWYKMRSMCCQVIIGIERVWLMYLRKLYIIS